MRHQSDAYQRQGDEGYNYSKGREPFQHSLSYMMLDIELICELNAGLEVKKGELPELIIAEPVVLERYNIVLGGILAARMRFQQDQEPRALMPQGSAGY